MNPNNITFTVEKEVTLEQLINEQIAEYRSERQLISFHSMPTTVEESMVRDIKMVRIESKIDAMHELMQKLKQSK